jgi:hypothetical protein
VCCQIHNPTHRHYFGRSPRPKVALRAPSCQAKEGAAKSAESRAIAVQPWAALRNWNKRHHQSNTAAPVVAGATCLDQTRWIGTPGYRIGHEPREQTPRLHWASAWLKACQKLPKDAASLEEAQWRAQFREPSPLLQPLPVQVPMPRSHQCGLRQRVQMRAHSNHDKVAATCHLSRRGKCS